MLTSITNSISTKKIEDYMFIGHPDFKTLFDIWYKKQFPRKKAYHSKLLNLSGNSNQISASLSMVQASMGVTILPELCASDLLQSKQHKNTRISKELNSQPKDTLKYFELRRICQ